MANLAMLMDVLMPADSTPLPILNGDLGMSRFQAAYNSITR